MASKQSPAGTSGTEAYKKYRTSEKYKKTSTNSHLKRTYGITLDEYTQMLEEQGNVCKICKKINIRKSQIRQHIRPLFVDHCHATGKVRGLLCHKCNAGIAAFCDDPEFLMSAISYLKESKS